MQNGSTAALTAVNASMTAQSAMNAERAHVERCKAELLTYAPQSASVAQMQSYALCVQTVYPEHKDPMGMKIVVGTLLIFTLIGAVIGAIRSYGDFILETFFGGFVGLFSGLIFLTIAAGVIFLFS